MLPEENGDSDLDDEGIRDSRTRCPDTVSGTPHNTCPLIRALSILSTISESLLVPWTSSTWTDACTVHESLDKDEIMIAQIMTSSSGPVQK